MADRFTLPRLRAADAIADREGRAVNAFVRFWDTVCRKIEEQEATQNQIIDDLAQAVADIQAAMEAAQAAQEAANTANDRAQQALGDLVLVDNRIVLIEGQTTSLSEQTSALGEGVQVAQATGNAAREVADAAAGSGSVSAAATDPSVNLSGGPWEFGPQVDLTGVVAGILTITGTGPYQDGDMSISGGDSANEFRVVEIVGGVESTIFTGSFVAAASSGGSSITNQSIAQVAAFSSSRPSTGSVSYRIDARTVSGGLVNSLALYIYARRAA